MGVYKRSGSPYWFVQFTYHNKTVIKSSRSMNKNIALRLEREMRNTLICQVEFGDKEEITVIEAFDMHLNSKKSSSGIGSYKSSMKQLLKVIKPNEKLHTIQNRVLARLLEKWRGDGLAEATSKFRFDHLKMVINYCKRIGYKVPELEFPKVKPNKNKLRYLSYEEEARLLMALDPNRVTLGLPSPDKRGKQRARNVQDNYDLVVMLLQTGARYSEIAHMRWSDVNFKRNEFTLYRQKVGNESVLHMNQASRAVLESRRRNKHSEIYVFTNNKGGPRNHCTGAIMKAYKVAGITGATIHTLRHTVATRLVQSGMSLYEISKLLGHSTITMTMRYATIEQATVTKKAADMLDALNDEHLAMLDI